MPATQNAALRNALAATYADELDRLELLDGATVIGTVSLTLTAGAEGVVTVDPSAATYAASGEIDGARLYSSTGSAQITGVSVSTVAAGTGHVQVSNLTAVSGESIDLSVASITIPASVPDPA
jgi:hypothetical protein